MNPLNRPLTNSKPSAEERDSDQAQMTNVKAKNNATPVTLDLDLQVFAFSQLLAHLARSGAHLLVFLKPTKCFWWNYQNKRINTNKVHFL